MKSRLAVSILFTLIASTFASDVTTAFEKFRSWTIKACSRGAEIRQCLITRESAVVNAIKGSESDGVTMIQLDGDRLLLTRAAEAQQPLVVGTISPDGRTITFNSLDGTRFPNSQPERAVVFKIAGPDQHNGDEHNEAFGFITTALRQMREVLVLMRIK